tara:strand:- start:7697 stop:8002 length:306 start_codon:yes stop_codon:yes gene_type:complete
MVKAKQNSIHKRKTLKRKTLKHKTIKHRRINSGKYSRKNAGMGMGKRSRSAMSGLDDVKNQKDLKTKSRKFKSDDYDVELLTEKFGNIQTYKQEKKMNNKL